MDCNSVIAGLVGATCGKKKPIGGAKKRLVFVNYDDINFATSTVDGVKLTALALKQGKTGYLFTSVDNSTAATATLTKGTYVDTFDHSVTPRIFTDSNEAREWIENAKGSRVVILMERRSNEGELWEVWGWDSGLVMKEMTYDINYQDGVVFAPVFATDDTSKESGLPLAFSPTTGTVEAAVLAVVAEEEE